MKIKNYRGIQAAEINLSESCLVVGRNGAGKSSIAQAAAMLLTRTATLPGMTKVQGRALLRNGESRGYVEQDGTKINWPGCTITEGESPFISMVSAGIIDPTTIQANQMAAIFGAIPTESDLLQAIPSSPADLWQQIEANGWDYIHSQYKTNGTRLKGRWEQVTGEKFGIKKAEAWNPFGGDIPDRDSLNSALIAANAARDEAVKNMAVSQHLIEQNIDIQRAGQTASEQLADAVAEAEECSKQLTLAIKERTFLPQPDAMRELLTCPHCGEQSEYHGGALHKPAQIPDELENAKRAQAIADQDQKIQVLNRENREASEWLDSVKRDISAGERASKWLEAAKSTGTTEDDIRAHDDEINSIRYQISMLEAYETARDIFNQISETITIVNALSPDGVRASVLARELATMNAALASMAETSGWKLASINHEFQIEYDGRPYKILSESEKFRCRVLLQLMISMRQQASIVIIDAADILDGPGRLGLIKLTHGLRVMICMTANKPEKVPNAGMRRYWVENGTVTEI